MKESSTRPIVKVWDIISERIYQDLATWVQAVKVKFQVSEVIKSSFLHEVLTFSYNSIVE